MEELVAKIKGHLDGKLPFAAYSLPQNDTIKALFQKDDQNYTSCDFSDKGFVFAPFDGQDVLLIPEEQSEIYSVEIAKISMEAAPVHVVENPSERKAYRSLVQLALESILEGNASKIVVSRRKEVPWTALDYSQLVQRIFSLDVAAFRYIWYHPKSGLWCGVTPEILLKTEGNEFSTMALAGTKKYVKDGDPVWTLKEINEQRWVSDAVAEKLEPAASVVKVSKTTNHRAGSLLHLRTDFRGILKKGKNNMAILTRSLHPTPAVCGTPDTVAQDFILKNEGYDREFYTGYLGPVDAEKKSSWLFVNLRCMKINKDSAYLYVGGGITQFSKPDAEWEETHQKLQTMLQVLAPML